MISHCAGSASAQEERETGMLKTYTVEVEKTYRQVVKVKATSYEDAMQEGTSRAARGCLPERFQDIRVHIEESKTENQMPA